MGAGAPWRLRCSKAFRGDACLPLPWPRQWIPQWTGGAGKGDAEAPTSPGSGIPKFRPIPLWRLGSPRHLRLCSPWDCPLPSAPSCPSFWLPFSASSSGPVCLYLCVSVYVCVSVPYHSGLCLSVSSSVALYLALSYICFSLGVSLLPSTSLYLAGSLFTNAFLTAFISISPLPFPSSIAIIWLAAPGWVGTAAVVQRDCLGTTRGTA